MSYDANGNLTKDLDRDIVTIKYNLLNLPEIIQFKNGNQIRNLYDASGQKLSMHYKTMRNELLQPLNVGEILDEEIGNTYDDLEYVVEISGVDYIGNLEYLYYRFWDIAEGVIMDTYSFDKLHNPEGYCQSLNPVILNYFRRDHLGNYREVWRAPYTSPRGSTVAATTIQHTQYYPSGLPWESNSGDDPWTQNKKYNGKEFVEMHGLDEYDSEARWMYPAIMRTTTIDPLAEKYYSISPYAWCGNNPVRMVDPSGMAVEDPKEIQWLGASGYTRLDNLENFDNSTHNVDYNNTPDYSKNLKESWFGVISGDISKKKNMKESGGGSGGIKTNSKTKHQIELEKYGVIQSNVNLSGTLSLGGGGAIEFGYVVSSKGYAQYYFTLYTAATIAAGVSGNFTVIKGLKGYQPTFSNWEGKCAEGGGNYGPVNFQIGGDLTNKYITYTGGLGIGATHPASGTGGAFGGTTYLIGKPLNMNSKGFGTRSYEITHGY